MARRRKDIKKRRQAQEEQQASPSVDDLQDEEIVEEEEVLEEEDVLEEGDVLEEEEITDEISDDEIVLKPESPRRKPPPETGARKPVESKRPDAANKRGEAVSSGWFGQYKDNLLLGLLVIYVLLLGLGTFGELFEIEWVLDLPLFR